LFGVSAIFSTNPHVYRKIPFDVRRDFAAVEPIVKGYPYLFVPATSPASSLQQFVELAKEKKGKMTYGSLGIGTNTHLAMEEFKHRAGIDLTHVPYKAGTPEVIRALITGELDAAFDFYTPVMAQVKAGKLKALAIAAPTCNPAVPHIPTFAESGFPGFEHYGWAAIFAPAGTPAAIIEKLRTEIIRARASEEVHKTIQDAGAIELKLSPPQFADFLQDEYSRGAKLVKLAGATLE
jgi:tripartite-type tricarboxylate transporter receptor subunit TctC